MVKSTNFLINMTRRQSCGGVQYCDLAGTGTADRNSLLLATNGRQVDTMSAIRRVDKTRIYFKPSSAVSLRHTRTVSEATFAFSSIVTYQTAEHEKPLWQLITTAAIYSTSRSSYEVIARRREPRDARRFARFDSWKKTNQDGRSCPRPSTRPRSGKRGR